MDLLVCIQNNALGLRISLSRQLYGNIYLINQLIIWSGPRRMTTNVGQLSCELFLISLHFSAIDMIHENSPITNTFISVPADMGQLNCAAYLAGIVSGILESCRFVSI